MAEPARPRAHDIYERVRDDAQEELERPNDSILFSGLFAGFTIGAAPLVVALALETLGASGGATLIAYLLYPVGFIAVIVGRSQLFTENTLYPVILSLQDRAAIRGTARLWGIVYAANVVGSVVFAVLATQSGALDAGAVDHFTRLGVDATAGSFAQNFWSAVVAGWLLALIAWLVEATESAIAQVSVIWFLAFIVGIGAFDHCVATAVEVGAALVHGDVGFGDAAGWLATATLGNVAGGVLIVSLLNYGQVRAET